MHDKRENMKAIYFEKTGRAEEVLVSGAIPRPVPGKEEVLIEVSASPIQPADFLFMEGRYRKKPVFPQIAGFEGVGKVVDCGEAAAGQITPGMRVAFRSIGAWAEYALAPISRIYPVPEGIPDELACQFSLNPLTAWGLLEECGLAGPARILATAGHSAVARLLSELAKARGIDVVLIAREDQGYRVTRQDEPLSWRPLLSEAVNDASEGGRFHAILDPVGGPDILSLIDALEPGGKLISYGLLDDREITLRASMILSRNMIWQGFGIDGWLGRIPDERLKAAQKELWTMLSVCPELLPVSGRFDYAEIGEAVRAARLTAGKGKVLIS